ERDLDLGALDLAVDVEGRDVDHRLVAVQGAHEGDDAAVEIEGAGVAEGLVSQSDLQPLVEVRHLAQAVLDDLAVEFGVGEDLGVGPEPNDGAGAVGLADGLDPGAGHTALVLLLVDLAAPVHPNLEPLAEEVDGGNPDAVESRRDFVSAAAELAARVEAGHHQLQGREAFLLVHIDRDAPAGMPLARPAGVLALPAWRTHGGQLGRTSDPQFYRILNTKKAPGPALTGQFRRAFRRALSSARRGPGSGPEGRR